MLKFLKNIKKEDALIFPIAIGSLILFTRNTLDNQLIIKFVFVSLMLLIYSIILLIQKRKWIVNQSIPILFIVLISYLLLSGLTLFNTNNLSDGIFSFFRIFLFIGIIVANYLLFNDYNEFIKSVTKSFTLACSVLMLISIFQLIKLFRTLEITHHNLYTVSATIGHKNLLSQVLLLGFPFSLYASFYLNKFYKTLGIVNAMLSIVLITILMTRSVWIAIIAGIIITAIFSLISRNLRHHFLRNSIVYGIIFIFLISCSVFVYSKIDKSSAFQKQLTNITNFNYATVKDRINLWENSYNLFKEKPLFGHGLGSWKINILKYGNQNLRSEDNLTFYQRPHNDYLWILCEGGILTLCFYLLIFVICFIYTYKLASSNISTKNKNFILLFIFTISGYLTFSFFSFPIERIEHLVILSFLISSILLIKKNELPKVTSKNFKYQKISLYILTLMSILSFIWGIYRLQSELYFKKAFIHRNQSNWKLLIKDIDKSSSFFYRIDPFSTPLAWYRGVANFSLGNYSEAEIDFEKARKINPYHIHILNNLGTCKGINKHEQEAINLYKKAVEIAPNFNEAYYNLCTLYFQFQDIDSAIYYLEKIKNPVNHEKYNNYISVVVESKIATLKNESGDQKYTTYINQKLKDEEWIIDIFNKYLQTKKTIEVLVELDFNTNFK